MKVYNLCCAQQHVFEGWFASEDDFQSQQDRGLLTCPLCSDACIQKRPTAPRLNLSGACQPMESQTLPEEVARGGIDEPQLQAALMRAMRDVVSRTEDVGERFADQARAMHQGDMAPKPIRGRATVEQTRELLDDGVPILPLPMLPGLKDPLH